jgi:hypothetical protein
MKGVTLHVDDEWSDRRIRAGVTWKRVIELGIVAAEKEKVRGSEPDKVPVCGGAQVIF